MINMMIKPAKDNPTTSLVVLFQLGEEVFSGVVIKDIIKDICSKNEELAITRQFFNSNWDLWANTRLDRVKYPRE